jgi:hypothetical protein
MFVDHNHSVSVADVNNHRVMKCIEGAKEDIVVTGGQSDGNDMTQFYYPRASRKPLLYTIKIDRRK